MLEFMGVTENISRNGVLLRWTGAAGFVPRLGEAVRMDIELPANHEFGRKCIHCQGTVVRIFVPDGDAPRVALAVSYMKFRDQGQTATAFGNFEAGVGGWTF